jgi:hypothetical protein
MKLALLLPLALVAACKANPDDYPPGGGPGGSGVGNGTDAATDGVTDGGPQLTGRVCVVDDMRKLNVVTECQKMGVLDLHLVVSIGAGTAVRTAMTTDDGTFTIGRPQGSGFIWHVDSMGTVGTTVFPSSMPFGTDNTIPALTTDRYGDLLGSNEGGQMLLEGQASIVVRVVNSTVPAVNVVATAPDALTDTRYDVPNNADVWGITQTGASGIAWFPVVQLQQPPVAEVVTMRVQGAVVATQSVTLEDQRIMFVTQDLQ